MQRCCGDIIYLRFHFAPISNVLYASPRFGSAQTYLFTITMAIVENWLPPSRENWELVCRIWQFFPIVSTRPTGCAALCHDIASFVLRPANISLLKITAVQWVLDWYPQGKTSTKSRFNIDGKIGWATMESAGFITLLYIMYSLPKELGLGELPWGNWTMAGCFVSTDGTSA
jgi:3-oxo-5-alpha-steroid 4-dehydrogenase 1